MENEKLVKYIQSGINVNENLMILWNQNIGLINVIVKKHSYKENYEDLLQESYFGFYRACMKYNPEIGPPFANYMCIWINATLQRSIRNTGSLIRIPVNNTDDHADVISIETPIEDNLTIADALTCETDLIIDSSRQIDHERMAESLRSAIDSLEPIQRDVIYKRHFENMTLQEISNQRGVNVSTTHGNVQRAYKELRRCKNSDFLKSYYEDYIECEMYRHRSIQTFTRTNTSATEHAALILYGQDKS